MCVFFFFFSSRRRHTRGSRDWSSDVCSSDLAKVVGGTYTSVAATTQTVSNDTWYRYGVGVAGSTLRGWFNETEQLSATDTAVPGAGSVGVYNVYSAADAG